MKILAFETSCDETSVAVLDGKKILSNIVVSQMDIHAEFGGVVPEVASRHHVTSITKVIEKH
jgi:N6-L-threonylcarbamoyladenine synthase